ncbi:hypothetical protein Tco_1484882, partial [Tanacetum coccineum]
MGEGSTILTDPHHTSIVIELTSQPPKKQRSRNPKRKDSEILTLVTTSSLEAEQDSGNIDKTRSKATPNEPSSLGTSSGGGPRRQDTMGDTIARTRFENVSKTSNDSLLAGVNTPQSDEDRLKLNELMEFYTKLQQRVLDLENTKTAQAQEITSLKLRVKKLEKKGGSRTHKLKRLYKVGRSARVISSDEASLGDQEDASKQGRKIDDIDKDAEITLVHETQGRYGDEEMFDTGVLDGDEVLAEPEVTIKDVNLSVDEVTLAQALAALKSAKVQEKANVVEEPSESITTTPTLTTTTVATTITAVSTRPKAKGLVIHEEEQATTPIVSSQQPSQVKAHDKGKGIMVEEPMKMKKKDQISLNEELAFKLQAKEEEKERLAREKAQKIKEDNIVAWCSWCGGPFNSGNYRHCTNVSFGDEPVYDSNLNSYNQTPDFSNPLKYHNYKTDSSSDTGVAFQAEFAKLPQNFERFMAQQSCSYCGGPFNDGNCPSCSIVGARNEFVHDPNPFPYNNTPDFYDQPPQPHTIPEKESDEVIKSSVEDLVPIPSESEDTSDNDSECDLPFCDNPVTFSNPL